MAYVFFFVNVIFWPVLFRSVVLCYLLIDPHVCGKISCAGDCMYYTGAILPHVDDSFLKCDEGV